jgi:hypothetical protein
VEELTKLIEEFEPLINELYLSIQKEKGKVFRKWKSQIEHTLKRTIGQFESQEELKYFKNKREEVNDRVFKNGATSPTHIINPITKKTFIKNEFSHPSQFDYARKLSIYADWKDVYISSLATKYFSPHQFDYLNKRIEEISTRVFITSPSLIPIKNQKVSRGSIKGGKPKVSNLIWVKEENDPKEVKLDKRIRYLHHHLREKRFIAPISYNNFRKHFTGIIPEIKINWNSHQYYIVYFLNNLKPYLHPSLYKLKNPSPTTIGKHFLLGGQPINQGSLRSTSANKELYLVESLKKSLDLIIRALKAI